MELPSRGSEAFTASKPLANVATPAPAELLPSFAQPPFAPPLLPQPPLAQPASPTSPMSRTWPRSAQWTAAALLGVVLTLLGVHIWAGSRSATKPSTQDPGVFLDLNVATRAELLQLPGIGPGLADRILAYRRAHGPFRNVQDLRKVPGFGPATWQRVRDFLFVESDDLDGEDELPRARLATSIGAKRPAKSQKEAALAGKTINVNTANATELQMLPSIGPKMSQRIVDERQKRRFASAEELRRVSGIGPKTLEKLRPYVRVADDKGGLARIE
jgi:competence protein ComEA